MARNTKLQGRAKKDKKGYTATIKLDPETAAIWNTRKKYENMSSWVRTQLLFHYGGMLTDLQKKIVLKEEYAVLQQQKIRMLEKVNKEYDALIFEKARQMMAMAPLTEQTMEDER